MILSSGMVKKLRPGHKFGARAFRTTDADGSFEGYASLFGKKDLGNDIVMRGAFTQSLKSRGASGVKLLYQHDQHEPLGIWEIIREDTIGLYVKGRLSLDVRRAKEVHALMKAGALDGLSIGFHAVNGRRDSRTGVRKLHRIDLWEISIVTFPMLTDARISAVKHNTANQLTDQMRYAKHLMRSSSQIHTS